MDLRSKITLMALADITPYENNPRNNEELEQIESLDMSEFGFEKGADIKWDDVPELDAESYEEPSKEKLECPKCHHIAGKEFFKKVKE